MKPFLLSLCIFFAISSHAQQASWFTGISHDSARAFCDSIAAYTNDGYQYSAETKNGEYVNATVFRYKNGYGEEMPIVFRIDTVNREPRLFFTRIYGFTLEQLFPLWQRFIDPNANMDDLANAGDAVKVLRPANGDIPAKKAKLYKEDNQWELWIH